MSQYSSLAVLALKMAKKDQNKKYQSFTVTMCPSSNANSADSINPELQHNASLPVREQEERHEGQRAAHNAALIRLSPVYLSSHSADKTL